MDRDYTVYDYWREYLGPLGAKAVRLQAGWAKCEREPGQYDFAWLDAIIDDVLVQGVHPWLQTSYGNPIYSGGGDFFLGGGLPTSDVALAAWDRWVSALTERYRDRVRIWEIWNEPDLDPENSAERYTALYVRTARIIRAAIPEARLYALSLARVRETAYVETFLQLLQKQGCLDLVDEITVHGYTRRPEEILPAYETLKNLLARYDPRIVLRQGELGCPSEHQAYYALREYPWTEASQVKWMLRRLLGDLGHDIPSLYFTIIDIVYERYQKQAGIHTINRKGLLKANDDRTVAGVKPAYYAFQHLAAIFDERLARIPHVKVETNAQRALAAYGYRERDSGGHILSLWFDDEVPGDDRETTPLTVTVSECAFQRPAFVDLFSGDVYTIPEEAISREGERITFHTLPLYDSPILVAENSVLNLAS
jgi:hypothetical protein